MSQQHIGFIVVSNRRHQDFRYPLIRHDLGHAVKMPGMGTMPVSLSAARKQGAKLLLNFDLDTETRAMIQKAWER
ncbi:MAG: hypothetical protein ACYCS8_17345 [Acidithiobacillus sp.]